MSQNQDKTEKRKSASIGELGPVWITAIAALIVALAGAGFFAGNATSSSNPSKSTTSPTVTASPAAVKTPFIRIQDPTGGDSIPISPVVTGTVKNLAPDEVVWSFNEPYTTGSSPLPSGLVYPDAGPCRVNGSSFRCNLVFAGDEKDYCRQVRLWVAVVTVDEANDDANIKSGITGNTYISLRENQSPPHIASAIDNVHVQRNPKSGGSC